MTTKLLRIPAHTRRAPSDAIREIRDATTLAIALEMQSEAGIIEACMWQLGDICERDIRAELTREGNDAAS